MNKSIVVKLAAAAAVVALAGCQDLKPLQADISGLKDRVSKLESDVAAAKSSADSASRAASAAQASADKANSAASGAQSTVGRPGCSVLGGRDQREDRSHVQEVGLQVTDDRLRPGSAAEHAAFS